MKKLVISVKSSSQLLKDAKAAFKDVKVNKKKADTHFEVSFTDMKDFKRFVSNLDLLAAIKALKPKSIYELACLLNKDTANINRIVNFFESVGAIRIQKNIVRGRAVKMPRVEYSKIELNLDLAA